MIDRWTIAVALGALLAHPPFVACQEAGAASTGENWTQETKPPAAFSKAISYRPLLGGFDEPVTGTHINGHFFVDGAENVIELSDGIAHGRYDLWV